MTAFDVAFTSLVGLEGKYSDDANDPGNWTGGAVNAGKLNGTMYGISAKSYPALDIKSLSLIKAKKIYLDDFWDRMRCDAFPDQVAIALFKMAVNEGTGTAVKSLQKSLKIDPDGVVGQTTIGYATSIPLEDVLAGFLAQCAFEYAGFHDFQRYGHGWLARIVRTALQADLH